MLVIVIHKLRLYPRPHGKLDCESVHRTEIREVTPNQANTVRARVRRLVACASKVTSGAVPVLLLVACASKVTSGAVLAPYQFVIVRYRVL